MGQVILQLQFIKHIYVHTTHYGSGVHMIPLAWRGEGPGGGKGWETQKFPRLTKGRGLNPDGSVRGESSSFKGGGAALGHSPTEIFRRQLLHSGAYLYYITVGLTYISSPIYYGRSSLYNYSYTQLNCIQINTLCEVVVWSNSSRLSDKKYPPTEVLPPSSSSLTKRTPRHYGI